MPAGGDDRLVPVRPVSSGVPLTMPSLLVTAPTGNIGAKLVEILAAEGEDLRVIVRDPGKLPPSIRDRVEVVAGSHLDPETARRAAEGTEAVFWLTPPAMVDDQEAYHRRAAEAAVAAAGATGRLVNLSSYFADRPGVGLISSVGVIEEALRRASPHLVTLRAGNFMENFLNQAHALAPGGDGVLRYPFAGEVETEFVATADLALAASGWLVDRSWTGQHVVGAVGPARMTYAQAAATIGDVLERPVRHEQVPMEAFRGGLLAAGLPSGFVGGYVAMLGELARLHHAGILPSETARRGPTTLRRFAAEVLKPTVHPAG